MKELALTVMKRWSAAWREVVAGTIAAILTWVIAEKIFSAIPILRRTRPRRG
jgi:hypothetical protein